jgi:3'-phosphoadenosine 5'-phosphosulfate sulfotransferase (PAPS reductase)/FAD synthetase
MTEVLSYGAGVHSTAILVLLKPKEVVFADTGAEWPETYRYIREYAAPFVDSYGGDFHVVFNQKWTLEEMALHDHMAPVRTMRWCSDKFKVKVILKWLESSEQLPCIQLLGFDVNEQHRAKPSGRDDITNRFPLIELGMTRLACQQVIKKAGLPVPRKSGCFFCPFQSKGDFIQLRSEHRPLFERAVTIEKNALGYERGFYLAGDAPLEQHVQTGRIHAMDDQHGLFKCACYDGQMQEVSS